MNLAKSLAFVKSQSAYHAKQSGRSDIDPSKAAKHQAIAGRFDELADDIERMVHDDRSPNGSGAVTRMPRQLKLGDISDLRRA